MVQENEKQNPTPETQRFLRLLMPIQGRIYAYILSQWPHRADADDIMQETTAVLWEKFETYQPGTDFLAWSITVAKYTVLKYRKKRTRHPIPLCDEAVRALQDESDAFFKKFDRRLGALKECVKKLPPRDGQFLQLRYEQELPPARIAGRFDLSTRAVYKSLSRIHHILMRCIRHSLAEDAAR